MVEDKPVVVNGWAVGVAQDSNNNHWVVLMAEAPGTNTKIYLTPQKAEVVIGALQAAIKEVRRCP